MFNTQCSSWRVFLFLVVSMFAVSCSVSIQISKTAREDVLTTKALINAHVGISIFDPAANKFWYDYQGDKYFVPASNTKLATCYAAMKYLGDSLVGMKYGYSSDSDYLAIQPTGDPTFLHADYKRQPVMDFLKLKRNPRSTFAFMDTVWKDERWGSGWTWNDYDQAYMAERSSMPIYGNTIIVKLKSPNQRFLDNRYKYPVYSVFKTNIDFFDSLINEQAIFQENVVFGKDETVFSPELHIEINRSIGGNEFQVVDSKNKFSTLEIPFVTDGSRTATWIIEDSLKTGFGYLRPKFDSSYYYTCPDCGTRIVIIRKWNRIYSQPTDSMLKIMMHRSDNFYAEQSLLMVSNQLLSYMNDSKITDTLLKTDFKDLPQKPRWADGSGLSRYNLFTPQDFVAILNKMKNEFGMPRLKVIMQTGGEGTISNYYKADSGYIYGKTGTLSGVVAFSGFLYTKKGKLLIFSTLVNNHQGSATDVRRAVEKFLQGVRARY